MAKSSDLVMSDFCYGCLLGLTGFGFIVGLLICILLYMIYMLILTGEAATSSITSTYLLCEVQKNITGFVCPDPWYHDTWKDASEGSRLIASGLFYSFIVAMSISIVVQFIRGICYGRSLKSQYESF